MRIFKLIDFWMQVAIMVVIAVVAQFFVEDGLTSGAFFIGGWQVLSMLTHALVLQNFYPSKSRKRYAKTVLIVFIVGILTFPYAFILFLYALCIIGPFCAFWYLNICYQENLVLAHKRLIHLK